MFSLFRKETPSSPTGLTGQPFTVNDPDNKSIDYHTSRITEIEESIVDLKAQGKPTAGYDKALAYHKFIVSHLSV